MENISEKKTFYFIPIHTQNQQTICEKSTNAKKKLIKNTMLTINIIVHCIIVLCSLCSCDALGIWLAWGMSLTFSKHGFIIYFFEMTKINACTKYLLFWFFVEQRNIHKTWINEWDARRIYCSLAI